MTESLILSRITQFFSHEPTAGQARALRLLAGFLASQEADSAFLLRGYAGTGKSSLLAALVKAAVSLGQPVVLLAPTGRAARRLAQSAGHAAFTIHKFIYRQQAFRGRETPFSLAPNLRKGTLFVVDEASLISCRPAASGSVFGSGALLDDLAEEGLLLDLRGDLEAGRFYFRLGGDVLETFLAEELPEVPADAWFLLDLKAMYEAEGMDYAQFLALLQTQMDLEVSYAALLLSAAEPDDKDASSFAPTLN